MYSAEERGQETDARRAIASCLQCFRWKAGRLAIFQVLRLWQRVVGLAERDAVLTNVCFPFGGERVVETHRHSRIFNGRVCADLELRQAEERTSERLETGMSALRREPGRRHDRPWTASGTADR